jgi:hypothetical protein
MFNLFKRDPARERLKIPTELFSVTATCAANAANILNGAGLRGKFSREALFAEVCGYHVETVISTMSRVEDWLGFSDIRFDKGAQFLLQNAADVLARLGDPKISNGLQRQGFTSEDMALLKKLLFAGGTFDLAASYFVRMVLDVTGEDVLDFGRKYNPKLLTVSSEERSKSIYAYIVRCVRLSHLEDISDHGFRTSHVARFNDTLVQGVLEMEQNVEKLIAKRSSV